MNGPRRAVIIGVDTYKDETIPVLYGAINDAREVYEKLSDEKSGGFEIAKEHFLVGQDATCEAIRAAVSDLLWEVDHSALSLFYFSGHGFQDEYRNGYIAPYDIQRNRPFVSGIRMQDLTELVNAAKNKERILIILDCCYSGIATEGKGASPSDIEGPRFAQWFEDLDHEDKGRGRIIMASSGRNEKSREKLECIHTLAFTQQPPHPHGTFTFHLLEGLDGRAEMTEADAITLGALQKYIEAQMTDPETQPTFSGAGMRQADRIIIARAHQWRKIQNKLREAEEFLSWGEPRGVFHAIRALRDIVGTCENLSGAIVIKNQIDEKVQQYQTSATVWLRNNRFSIETENREWFSRIRDVVVGGHGLCLDTILKQDDALQSLLLTLCEVSSTNPDTNEPYLNETIFINELKSLPAASTQKENKTGIAPFEPKRRMQSVKPKGGVT